MTSFKKYYREIVAVTGILTALNVLQLFLTQFIFENFLSVRQFLAALSSPLEARAILLHVLFGIIFGLVLSIIFVRYQDVKMRAAERERLAKQDLEKAFRDLRKLDLLKTKFVDVVSHQLRTPINSIRWNLELLLGGDLGKLKSDQEQFIRLAYKSGRFMISIIDDLLVAMDVEEGRFRIDRAPVIVRDIIQSVLSEFGPDLRVKKLRLDADLPDDDRREITGDAIKLHQALARLVDNAVRYTPEGGVVRAKLEYPESGVRVVIADTGIGISGSEQAHLFEKFYRASNAADMNPDASGLGLYIAKAIITAHGGTVSLKSEEGKGTEVSILLPAVSYE